MKTSPQPKNRFKESWALSTIFKRGLPVTETQVKRTKTRRSRPLQTSSSSPIFMIFTQKLTSTWPCVRCGSKSTRTRFKLSLWFLNIRKTLVKFTIWEPSVWCTLRTILLPWTIWSRLNSFLKTNIQKSTRQSLTSESRSRPNLKRMPLVGKSLGRISVWADPNISSRAHLWWISKSLRNFWIKTVKRRYRTTWICRPNEVARSKANN